MNIQKAFIHTVTPLPKCFGTRVHLMFGNISSTTPNLLKDSICYYVTVPRII